MPTFVANLAKVVRLDVDKRVRARGGLALQPFGDSFEKLAAVKEQHCRVALERVVDELGRFFSDLQLWCNTDLYAGPVVEVDLPKLQVQLFRVAGIDVRLDDEFLALLPLAGYGRDQRALERGPGFRFDEVHDGQAEPGRPWLQP